jgi:TonB-linked SusC/RagA family outer membrane protein
MTASRVRQTHIRWAVSVLSLAALACVAWTRAAAQGTERRITGHVIDVDGKGPVPAARVVVVNTTIGAQASDSGTFALRVPPGAISLTVRRIGYTAATVPVAPDQNDVTISLTRDVLKLDAEVITGVATTISSKNSANDVAVLNSDQINQVPAPTIENALQGKIAGAVIQQNNGGAPGGGMQVQIRGITSINSNASPLYVIDGVLVNNETVNSGVNAITAGAAGNLPSNQDNSANRIADLNPNDIETIEVLKGASAAAIYGSKAASGVIIITTKKGTPGAAQWDLSGQAGTYTLANSLNLRKFPTLQSAQAWGATYSSFTPSQIASMYSGNHDYQQQFFGGGQLSGQGDLSVRGANGSTNYYASLHDQYDNGIMLGTGYSKQAIRTNLTQTFSSTLSASTNLYYQHSVTTRGVTGNDNVGISPYNVFAFTPQFFNLNQIGSNGFWVHNPFAFANPFADAAEIQTPTTVSRFIGGGNVNWQMVHTEGQDLTLSLIGGVDIAGQRDVNYSPPALQVEQHKPLIGTSVVGQANNEYYNYSLSLIHHFTGVSFLDATTSIGISQDRRTLDNPIIVGQSLPRGIQTPTAGVVQTTSEPKTDTKTMSLYGQEQILTLAQHLSLTAGLTADRNSNNGSFSRYYLYPKFAGSLRLPQFAGFIDEFKLRTAYGKSGTAPNYGYQYPLNASYTGLLHGGNIAVLQDLNLTQLVTILPDTHIKPETSTETEGGVDLTMLHSRLQLSGTVYNKVVNDLVLLTAPPASTGLSQVIINGGQFTNQGIELSLQASPIADPRGLTWISNSTFYRNYSRVDALPVPPFLTQYQFGGQFGTNVIQVGRSVSQVVNTAKLGKDGQAIQVGDATPADIMSFSQQLSFKRLSLSGVLDWYVGGTAANITNNYYDGGGLLADTAGSVKRLAQEHAHLTPYVESARFVKLREVRLSYELPDSWVHAMGRGRLRTVRIDVSGRNLIASFPYTGLDPEVSVFGNLAVGRSQDITPYPPARSVFVGIDLGL